MSTRSHIVCLVGFSLTCWVLFAFQSLISMKVIATPAVYSHKLPGTGCMIRWAGHCFVASLSDTGMSAMGIAAVMGFRELGVYWVRQTKGGFNVPNGVVS